MGTHHVHSRTLAGFLFLVALVALCCGGCGKTFSWEEPRLGPAQPEPSVAGSEGSAGESDKAMVSIPDEPGTDAPEVGVLGYSDPAVSEAACVHARAEDGWMSEQMGDNDDGCTEAATPSMANWGEDRMEMIGEESNGETNDGLEPGDYHEGTYEETSWNPPVTEQEYTPEPTSDTEQEYTLEATVDTEQEYKPEPTGDGNDSGSDVMVPYPDSDNGTTTDGDSADVAANDPTIATLYGMGRQWASKVPLVLESWWEAMVPATNEREAPRYETSIPSMPSDVDTTGSSCNPGP